MLTILSPAKKLLQYNTPYLEDTTTPVFQQKTDELIKLMKSFSTADLARLMHLSNDLAELNHQRYQSFKYGVAPITQTYPAILLFQGDVYQNLKARDWGKATMQYAQHHLAVLSGLYGLLKPLDVIQSYRLEMGTKLANACGKNLYDFWQTTITNELNKRLATHANPVLVNLASTEYFSAVNTSLLKVPVLTIHFKEQKNNQLKVIGIYAKKARGAMANYIMQHQIDDIEKIKQFTLLNYRYCEKSSDNQNFNFIRAT